MERTINYAAITTQLSALTEGVPYEVANLANASALLWQELRKSTGWGFIK